jgi:RNase P subunit RPR2
MEDANEIAIELKINMMKEDKMKIVCLKCEKVVNEKDIIMRLTQDISGKYLITYCTKCYKLIFGKKK